MGSTQHQAGLAVSVGRPAAIPRTPYSPYAAFHLPSDSSSASGGRGGGGSDDDDDYRYRGGDDDDESDLPFPTALSRKDFLAPTFDATAYLSSLFPSEDGSTSAQRHQTLEDLRAELRERSSAISAELLELVNANYTSFLGLGDELECGDDKIEDVRVALFGFRRAIEDVQARVRERRIAVAEACRDLATVRISIGAGRRLLELDDRIAQLEDRLAIAEEGGSGSGGTDGQDIMTRELRELEDTDDEDDEADDDEASEAGDGAAGAVSFVSSSPRTLAALAHDLVLANRLATMATMSPGPFVRKMNDRLAKCQSMLLLDLNSAVKEARRHSKHPAGQARLIKLLGIYRVLDREDEIVSVLKES